MGQLFAIYGMEGSPVLRLQAKGVRTGLVMGDIFFLLGSIEAASKQEHIPLGMEVPSSALARAQLHTGRESLL
jgi:hypothetical protein